MEMKCNSFKSASFYKTKGVTLLTTLAEPAARYMRRIRVYGDWGYTSRRCTAPRRWRCDWDLSFSSVHLNSRPFRGLHTCSSKTVGGLNPSTLLLEAKCGRSVNRNTPGYPIADSHRESAHLQTCVVQGVEIFSNGEG